MHHGVAALKLSDAEMTRRAIVAKYLSPPPAAVASNANEKVITSCCYVESNATEKVILEI